MDFSCQLFEMSEGCFAVGERMNLREFAMASSEKASMGVGS